MGHFQPELSIFGLVLGILVDELLSLKNVLLRLLGTCGCINVLGRGLLVSVPPTTWYANTEASFFKPIDFLEGLLFPK